MVHWHYGGGWIKVRADRGRATWKVHPDQCYSTREAAEAAKKEKG